MTTARWPSSTCTSPPAADGSEGTPWRGTRGAHGGFACYGLYRTSDDRWLAVGALEPKFFAAVRSIERPELLSGAYDVGEQGQKIRAELEKVFASRTQAEWVALFSARPLRGAVLEGDEILKDPSSRPAACSRRG